ncbi:hypothetical protein [Streptomyces sp. NPDC056524]|uniref:hypothetical protein n=1 Tax=Streptomyces sp. NPDC056524 TaxID=3345851 RepID=UPI0036AFCAA9
MTLAAFIGSDDSWSALIGASATLLAATVAVWATLYSVNPRRGLTWEITRSAALLGSRRVPTSVSVSSGSTTLRNPHLVDIQITNVGRRDIETANFSNGNDSLIFDLGADVVAVVDSTSSPETGGIGTTSHSGDNLHVHPFLLARKQSVTYSVLVDGYTSIRRARCIRAEITHNPAHDGAMLKEKRKLRRSVANTLAGGIIILALVTYIMFDVLAYKPLPEFPLDAKECTEIQEESPKIFEKYCQVTPKAYKPSLPQ